MRPRYPLDTLHWLRHQRVDRQAKVVGEESVRSLRAKAAEARAEQLRLQQLEAMGELSQAERGRLEEGALRAFDLQTLGDWQKGAELQLAQKVEQEARARAAHAEQVAQERDARRALGQVSNEAKAIDEHRQTFRRDAARAEDLSAEEAATEQWTASHFPPRRR